MYLQVLTNFIRNVDLVLHVVLALNSSSKGSRPVSRQSHNCRVTTELTIE